MVSLKGTVPRREEIKTGVKEEREERGNGFDSWVMGREERREVQYEEQRKNGSTVRRTKKEWKYSTKNKERREVGYVVKADTQD